MLLLIRDYLNREKMASNQQIAREFNLDVITLQPMLDSLTKKGWITPCQKKSACQQACFKCQEPPIYYQIK